MSYIHFIGIDVSKNSFDVACHGSAAKPAQFPNNEAGLAAFIRHYAALWPQSLVVLEATGGYETALLQALLAQSVAVHRADPRASSHFIRSLGKRAKTDALDAKALARYGFERHAELRLAQSEDAVQTELEHLHVRRDDLVAMRTAEKNRLQHPRYSRLKGDVEAHIKQLQEHIDALDARIAELIKSSNNLKEKHAVMTSVSGVGKHTATTLLAVMPQLGSLTRKEAASLAGCAPHPKDSGKTISYRRTGGGRRPVKKALFMAAMAARNFHPELKPFYLRLVQNGKKPMVALTAVMRKLITILNAKLRDLTREKNNAQIVTT
jgi:transposase